MSASVPRVAWIDAARGIGIILVVAGHVERGLVSAGIAQGAIWSWLDYGVYTFHMPLFFLLAGVNVPGSLRRPWRFLQTKVWTIAYPYVLWSIIQGSALVSLSSITNGQAHISDLLAIGWQPMAQFWFLYVLMACQLTALFLARRPRLLASIAVVSFTATVLLTQDGVTDEFLHAFPFFACGILLSDRVLGWRLGGDALWAGLAAIGLAISIPLSGLLNGKDFNAALALPSAVCGIMFLVCVSRMLGGASLRVAAGLGRMSMTIYVTHILASAGTRIAMVKLHIVPDPWLYLTACTVVGVAAPVVMHIVLERLDLLAPLGLAPLRLGTQKLRVT
jgi:fucose 4-O-acetylase-like acetyltransferase